MMQNFHEWLQERDPQLYDEFNFRDTLRTGKKWLGRAGRAAVLGGALLGPGSTLLRNPDPESWGFQADTMSAYDDKAKDIYDKELAAGKSMDRDPNDVVQVMGVNKAYSTHKGEDELPGEDSFVASKSEKGGTQVHWGDDLGKSQVKGPIRTTIWPHWGLTSQAEKAKMATQAGAHDVMNRSIGQVNAQRKGGFDLGRLHYDINNPKVFPMGRNVNSSQFAQR